MPLAAGTKLGPYEILSPLGAGGMGEVYLGKDAKLDRQVAIKVLPEAFSSDPERVQRFQREAKVLASLNHPNIASIHGFDDSDGSRFLVMEYVEGVALSERIAKGAVPVQDALDIGKQMADALEAAHEQGVIHRDLKPGNVMIRPDGSVKVLDFGLAKAMTEDTSSAGSASSPTLTADFTRPGVVLGTAAYMSPEQARGRTLDKRTDIWSFGCLLYELLTGRRPFEGQTNSDVIAKILERDPDLSLLPPNTPPKIIDLLNRCLEKSTKRRLRDIGDAALELDEAISARSWTTSAIMAATGPTYRGASHNAKFLAIALLLIGGAVGWVGSSLRSPDHSATGQRHDGASVARLSITIPEFIRPQSIRISPNGRLLAGVGRTGASGSANESTQVFTRSFDEYLFRPVRGTEGARHFCFSPDGKWLAFGSKLRKSEEVFALAKTTVDGSTAPLQLKKLGADWTNTTNTETWSHANYIWTHRDEIVLGDATTNADLGDRVMRISALNGEHVITRIKTTDSIVTLNAQSELPNRNGTVFDVSEYANGAFQMSVRAQLNGSEQLHILSREGSDGLVTETGHLLYTRGTRLLAVPFDEEQLTSVGGPVALIDGLYTTDSWANGDFDLSRNGTLVYLSGGRVGSQRRLTVVQGDGTFTALDHPGRSMEQSVSASRDGKKAVVVVTNAAGLFELWITELDVPRLRKFAANDAGDCRAAVWSYDGDYVYYTLEAGGNGDGIFRQRSDGTGAPEGVILASALSGGLVPRSVSPDNRVLLLERNVNGKQSLYAQSLSDTGVAPGSSELLLGGAYETAGAVFSPNGEWLIYSSNESGQYEVYIRPVDSHGRIGSPTPLTNQGGKFPRWSPDGRTVYFWSKASISAIEMDAATGRPTSAPRVFVDLEEQPVVTDDYTTLPGGRLLMIGKGPDEGKPTHVEVVLNWLEELKAKVPTSAPSSR